MCLRGPDRVAPGVIGGHNGIEINVESVEQSQTSRGNTRYTVRDAEGREFTTFRPGIGEQAARFEGRRARIEFHEEERNGFRNVYLDAIAEASEPPPEGAGGNRSRRGRVEHRRRGHAMGAREQLAGGRGCARRALREA